MIGDFLLWIWGFLKENMDAAAYFLNYLQHFPQVRERFWFLGWWGGFETAIGAVEFEKSAASQEFNHWDFKFLFLNFIFLDLLWYCLGQWYYTLANQDTRLGVPSLRGVFYGRRQTLSHDVLLSKNFHCTSNHNLIPCVNYM